MPARAACASFSSRLPSPFLSYFLRSLAGIGTSSGPRPSPTLWRRLSKTSFLMVSRSASLKKPSPSRSYIFHGGGTALVTFQNSSILGRDQDWCNHQEKERKKSNLCFSHCHKLFRFVPGPQGQSQNSFQITLFTLCRPRQQVLQEHYNRHHPPGCQLRTSSVSERTSSSQVQAERKSLDRI